MSNVGASAINLAGTVEVATPQRDTEIGLSTVIDEIEAKTNEYNIPANNSGSPFLVPLNLSTGVTEALVLLLQSASPLLLTLASSDVTNPGPFNIGLMGPMLLTMQPGEGIVSIYVVNPSTTVSVNLSVTTGALAAASDEPPYFFP